MEEPEEKRALKGLPRSSGSQTSVCQNHLEGLVRQRLLGPLRVFLTQWVKGRPKISLSIKSPGVADTPGLII